MKTTRVKIGSKKYPYCSNRQCVDVSCIRHYTYVPFEKLIWQEKFKPNKNNICKQKII